MNLENGGQNWGLKSAFPGFRSGRWVGTKLRLQDVFLVCHRLLFRWDLDSKGLLQFLVGELTGPPSGGSGPNQMPWHPD